MPYEVSTPVFEGPFDLLLHLITAEQVDLYEVSIARIVDAYVAEVERMERLDLEVATEFTLIAATLIELKCRRLLPGRQDVELDDELALWEERDFLLAKLVECKTFKDAASVLSGMASAAAQSVSRCCGPDERFAGLAPDLLAGVTPADMLAAASRALETKPTERINLGHVTVETVSVSEVVVELSQRLPGLGRTTFRSLTSHLDTRMQVIARFLALLELYKQGAVDLDQADTFGQLDVVWIRERGDGQEAEVPDGAVVGEYRG